ncbi:MAG: hypothetical protein K6D57_03120 [Paludibacteraceae bacterium]|nr:hypothetical protein [Paludibacteraceae bacterium]
MKKIIMTLAFAAAAMVGVNAQWSIGGAVGFEFEKNTDGGAVTGEDWTWNDDAEKTTAFGIAPKIGYDVNEDWTVGAYAGIQWAKYEYPGDEERKGLGWNIAPFARYNALQFGKFGIAFEGKVGVGMFDVDDAYNTFGVGFGVTPYLTYKVNDKWSLDAGLDFARLGFDYAKTDYDDAAYEDGKTTKFGIGVNANEIFTTGDITFGATYRF